MKRVLEGLVLGLSSVALCNGSGQPQDTPREAQQPIAPPISQEMLATVVLNLESQSALGLEVTPVLSVSTPERIVVAGEVMITPGNDLVLAAPASGRIVVGVAPRPGDTVRAGQTLLSLVPMAAVDRNGRASASRDLETARAGFDLAEARLERALSMLRDRAGSQRNVEDARAERQVALAEVKAAESRLRTLAGGVLDADVSLAIRSPVDGIVRAVRVAPGQSVPQGTLLLDIVGTGRWIRASLAASDARWAALQTEARARRVGSLDSVATPFVLASSSADPTRGSTDRFFMLPPDSDWTPGERVLIELTGTASASALGVPESAVVRDAEGGAWVYEQTGSEAFRRRRVEPIRRDGSLMLLARGPAPDARVVSTGAIELWGFELGADR